MSRVLIISLDGTTWDVLDPLIEDGTIGFLGDLIKRGSHGVLDSVIPPVTAPAWSSFMTGKHPDRHGVYEFRCFDIEKKIDYITNASYIQSETVWQILSRHKKKVISINVPYTYPVSEVNGIMISGMDTPSEDSNYCFPFSLKEVIKQRFPGYVPVMKAWDMKEVANESKALKYIDELLRLIDLRVKLTSYLLSEYDWDLTMLHLQETDYIQHVLWDRIVETVQNAHTSPLHIHKKIRDFYRKIDHYLERLVEEIDGEINLFIISDHGFTDHKGVIYPNVVFEKQGLLKREVSDTLIRTFKNRVRESRNPLIRVLYAFQKGIRDRFSKTDNDLTVEEKLKRQQSIETLPVRWDNSVAVMIMGSQYAFIHTKDNGKDICKDVLLGLKDERYNTHLFKEVSTLGEAYGRDEEGSHLLVAIAEDGYSVSRRFKEEFLGESYYPGIHHPQGIYIAYGEDVRVKVEERLNLIDIVPTCLRLLETPPLEDMDGKVAYSIIKREETDRYDKSGYVGHDKETYTEEDQRLIEERLRALGYI